jgi:hypothetical protein
MRSEWLAMEHYRIHLMETWPDGPAKEAGLAAARSALESQIRAMPNGSSFTCMTCASRRKAVTVMPSAPRVFNLPLRRAA